MGGPPPGLALPSVGESTGERNDEWIPLPKLFAISELEQLSAAQRTTFEAESWALVRWLIDNSRLAEAGAYLNAVQARGATPEQAASEAFGMSPVGSRIAECAIRCRSFPRKVCPRRTSRAACGRCKRFRPPTPM